MDYSVLVGIHDVEMVGKEDLTGTGTNLSIAGCPLADCDGRDISEALHATCGHDTGTASAGDGLGEVCALAEQQFHKDSMMMMIGGSTPVGVGGFQIGSFGSNPGVARPHVNSVDENEEEEEEVALSDEAVSPNEFDGDVSLSGRIHFPGILKQFTRI